MFHAIGAPCILPEHHKRDLPLMWQKSRVQSMKHSICGIYAHCYPIRAPVGSPGALEVTPFECYGASGHENAGKPSASRHLFSTHSLAGTASCFGDGSIFTSALKQALVKSHY